MAKWKVTTVEGVENIDGSDQYFDKGPSVGGKSGALEFEIYVQGRGNRTIAVYNKDYWLKAEIDE